MSGNSDLKSMKCGNRTVTINYVDQPFDVKGVAEVLTRYITGGDYEGYLRRIAEKGQNEKIY